MGEQIRLNLTVTLGEEENVYSEKKKKEKKRYTVTETRQNLKKIC